MSINGSAAPRASALHRHERAAPSGQGGRDRRRLAGRARPGRSSDRDPRRAAPDAAAAAEAYEVRDEYLPTPEDGLDPAFDEMGEVHDHVDGLSRWMRLGRAHPGRHDD